MDRARILEWIMVSVAFIPTIFAVLWHILGGIIMPALVPKIDIERLADDVTRRFPLNPEEGALIEEHAAWHRSLVFEQGVWRRVRREIKRRCKSSCRHCEEGARRKPSE